MRNSAGSGASVLVWMPWALLVAGPSAAGTPGASHPCAAIAAPEERLACFDRAFPGVSSAADDFGLSAQERLDHKTGGTKTPDRITASITEVSLRKSDRAILTLDNDQSWEIGPNAGVARVRAGERVTVRKASLGSFLLSVQGGLSFRAKRVK